MCTYTIPTYIVTAFKHNKGQLRLSNNNERARVLKINKTIIKYITQQFINKNNNTIFQYIYNNINIQN